MPANHRRMKTGTHAYQGNTLNGSELRAAKLQVFQLDKRLGEERPPAKRIEDSLRLFSDLLLHEMLEAALRRRDRIISDLLGRSLDCATRISIDGASRGDSHNIAVVEENYPTRMWQQGRKVARQVAFAVTVTDYHTACVSRSSCDNRPGLVLVHHQYGVSTSQYLNGLLQSRMQVFSLLQKILDQMGDHFRICFGREFMAGGEQLLL